MITRSCDNNLITGPPIFTGVLLPPLQIISQITNFTVCSTSSVPINFANNVTLDAMTTYGEAGAEIVGITGDRLSNLQTWSNEDEMAYYILSTYW